MAQIDLSSICYSRNFLSEVIARIDLVSPLPILLNELPKEISKSVLQHFPIDEPKPAFTQELLVSANEIATRKQEFTEWNFYGRNREKRLTINPQAFFASYASYQTYENFRKDFLAFVKSFFEVFGDAQPSRLGLRYINQLKIPGKSPLKWEKYVNNDLLGLFSYSITGTKPTRIFNTYEVSFEGFNLRFQFGIHNPDYPAPIRQRIFILDYDAYFQGLIEPQEIPDLLDEYHASIQETFEDSITDAFREYMNESQEK